MPAPRPELRRGRIVWAAIRDRNGILKERPVIVLTALSEGCLVQQVAKLGVQDFILKGAINAVDLIDRIARNFKPAGDA